MCTRRVEEILDYYIYVTPSLLELDCAEFDIVEEVSWSRWNDKTTPYNFNEILCEEPMINGIKENFRFFNLGF